MSHILLFLKGFLMGAVELIPGVSAGTIAFVTGIYTELLDSIKSINLQALKVWRKEGVAAFWKTINGNFLLTLLLGMALAIISLSRFIQFVLQNYPVLCWSFFFGLIIAASWYMAKDIPRWNWTRLLLLLLGVGLMLTLFTSSPASISVTPITLMLAGAIAISAMLMPGISGSFVLVIMGFYQTILVAINSFDVYTLMYFALGMGLGLLSVTRFLSWLLHRFTYSMQAFLTGVMLGSLFKIWPWKETLLTRINSKGEIVPLLEGNILPALNSELIYALVLASVGVSLVLLLDVVMKRWSK